MRNYQLRKTNNELTLKKVFFLVNNKWGVVRTVYICIYAFALYVLALLY